MNNSFIFFGSPRFAQIFFERSIEKGFVPAALVCNPDRPVGRKKVITPPPAKTVAQEHEILVLQPDSIRNNPEFALHLPHADMAVVAAYSRIIPQEVLDLFPKGVIGVHPSLLPRYRGASPIQSVLMSGDTKTGVALYEMDAQVDHGPVLAQAEVSVTDQDTYLSLEKKLAEAAADLFEETIPSYIAGSLTAQEQNHEEATFTQKIQTQDGYVDLEKDSSLTVLRKIKAFTPEPGVFTYLNGKRVKLLEAHKEEDLVVITRIIPEGKKEQAVRIELA